jgi:hypothetical protein
MEASETVVCVLEAEGMVVGRSIRYYTNECGEPPKDNENDDSTTSVPTVPPWEDVRVGIAISPHTTVSGASVEWGSLTALTASALGDSQDAWHP